MALKVIFFYIFVILLGCRLVFPLLFHVYIQNFRFQNTSMRFHENLYLNIVFPTGVFRTCIERFSFQFYIDLLLYYFITSCYIHISFLK